eukprot:3375262-Pleurochrysis_carterae.AAC.1
MLSWGGCMRMEKTRSSPSKVRWQVRVAGFAGSREALGALTASSTTSGTSWPCARGREEKRMGAKRSWPKCGSRLLKRDPTSFKRP